jgi:2-polyprenyl-3-methyl-5-hydroxy-6-metoxy-1,4-benzoquinol methylase
LDHVIPTEFIFGDQFTYLTGASKSLVEYFSRLADTLSDQLNLQPGDAVIDIGSNDGTFLNAFKSRGMEVLGIEGSSKSSDVALSNGIPTLVGFFGRGSTKAVKDQLIPNSRIRLITAMNVLAHTDNINEFLPEVVDMMGPDTVFVSQSHWLAELVRKFEFDTIYHEHLRYYTLGSLAQLFARHGLRIDRAEASDVYGGSIVVHARKGLTHSSAESLPLLKEESQLNIPDAIKNMKRVLLSNKAKLINMLVELKLAGKRVVGIGAPMKAATLLNFYGIDSDLIEYVAEVNQLKIGTVVPGVRVPVVNEECLFQDQPDYALLLTWNMADAIIPKYRSAGYTGKFILPVPQVEIL